MAEILVQRGIDSFESAKKFFRPSLDMLHDPFRMKDMDKAVTRILHAFENKESILVYGDYDVDGTTAVALMYGFINSFHYSSEFYIPDRYKEGYGISKAGIDYAHEKGISLIIALDCGIKSVDLIEYATSLGIDFIICDHHRPGDKIPKAVAVLDPKREDCGYPFKELSGCGIGFKLIQALADQMDDSAIDASAFLDLVAVSIAADIVSLAGENRVLAFYGLEKLRSNPSPGLKALIRLAGIEKRMNISSVVFGIAPRINAAGRISHAKGAVDLLLAQSEDEAYHFASKLDDKNKQRRDVDSSITLEALDLISENIPTNNKSTVLFKNDWHKGVIGIVASRCIEHYYRPTIILTESEGKATGSARSVVGFDVYEAIAQCSDLLDHFGGHKYAAGLTLPLTNVEKFKEQFEKAVSESITDEQLIPQIEIDTEINFNEITPKFIEVIKQMEPFGPENMAPIFSSSGLKLASSLKVLKDKHLKFTAKQAGSPKIYECIGFGLGTMAELLNQSSSFSMTYALEENEFRGNTTLQLNVKDIRID